MAKLSTNKVDSFDGTNRELDSIRDVLKESGFSYGDINPEGSSYEDYGYIYRNKKNGSVYVKTTPYTQNTGWKELVYVVDSGEENGNTYVQYSDGMMVCTLHINVTDQAIDTAYGSSGLYQGTRDWYFLKEFLKEPAVTCSFFKWSSSASWGTISGLSTTKCILRGIDAFSRASGTNVEIAAIAIGRWK